MQFHDLGVSCCFVSDRRINYFLPNHGSNQKRIILESSDRTQAVVSVVGRESPVIIETAFQYRWNMFKKGLQKAICILLKTSHFIGDQNNTPELETKDVSLRYASLNVKCGYQFDKSIGLFHCQVVSVVSYFIDCKEPLSTRQDYTTIVSDLRFQQIFKGYSEQIAIKSLLKTANELVFH